MHKLPDTPFNQLTRSFEPNIFKDNSEFNLQWQQLLWWTVATICDLGKLVVALYQRFKWTENRLRHIGPLYPLPTITFIGLQIFGLIRSIALFTTHEDGDVVARPFLVPHHSVCDKHKLDVVDWEPCFFFYFPCCTFFPWFPWPQQSIPFKVRILQQVQSEEAKSGSTASCMWNSGNLGHAHQSQRQEQICMKSRHSCTPKVFRVTQFNM